MATSPLTTTVCQRAGKKGHALADVKTQQAEFPAWLFNE
jgi:hypothetical protein